MIFLGAGLSVASGAFAAAVPAPRGGTGGFSRPAPVGAPRSPSPQPRGGPGTLGGYLHRPPSVSGKRGPYYPGGYYRGGYYAPFYYDPFYYDPFFAGGSGYYGYGSRSEADWSKRGNVQLHVDPKDVEVIVDGIPSAKGGRAVLDLPTGLHHIEIQRSGYRPWSVDLDVKQGVRYLLEQRLEKLPKEERQQEESSRSSRRRTGELRLDVQPSDAIVDIDGRFLGMANLLQDSTTLRLLPAGHHKLRFSRPGYRTVEREVDVSPDHPAALSVRLERE